MSFSWLGLVATCSPILVLLSVVYVPTPPWVWQCAPKNGTIACPVDAGADYSADASTDSSSDAGKPVSDVVSEPAPKG